MIGNVLPVEMSYQSKCLTRWNLSIWFKLCLLPTYLVCSSQALIHGLNRHYYSIAIDYRKNELEQQMLLNLNKRKWTAGLTLYKWDALDKDNSQTLRVSFELREDFFK